MERDKSRQNVQALLEANRERMRHIHAAMGERELLTMVAEASVNLANSALMMSRELSHREGCVVSARALLMASLERTMEGVICAYVTLTGDWDAVDELYWQYSEIWEYWQQVFGAEAKEEGEPVSTAEPASARGPDGGAEDGT